jgi:hypothetical protein
MGLFQESGNVRNKNEEHKHKNSGQKDSERSFWTWNILFVY